MTNSRKSTHVVKDPYKVEAKFSGQDAGTVTAWCAGYDDARTTAVALVRMYAAPAVTITAPNGDTEEVF